MRWPVPLQFLPNRWRDSAAPAWRDLRLSRFRQVLLAAHQTRGYREGLRVAGLDAPRAIARLDSIEEALPKLPRLSQAEFRAAPSDFHNPEAPPAAPQLLWSPTSTDLRAAVLAPNFRESEMVRVFDPHRTQDTRRFGPDLIAAPLKVLVQWAGAGRGARHLPSGQRAIVAFTGLEHGVLTDSVRDLLWRTFEVPVFEQRLGADGSVLAWECEAHEGLHILEENVILERGLNQELILTSLTDRRYPVLRLIAEVSGTVETEPCGCGRTEPRVVGLSDRLVAAGGR